LGIVAALEWRQYGHFSRELMSLASFVREQSDRVLQMLLNQNTEKPTEDESVKLVENDWRMV